MQGLFRLAALSLVASSAVAFRQLTFETTTDRVTLGSYSSTDRKGLRLIRTSEARPARWMKPLEVEVLMRNGIKFMDITEALELEQPMSPISALAQSPLPSQLTNQAIVQPIADSLNTELMKKTLETLTSFPTRYYKSDYGRQSSEWLYGQISHLAQAAAASDTLKVTVDYFAHAWSQKSIIARIESKTKPLSDETVIISAHQDSVNAMLPWFGRAPGADDDGSGTVTVMEAFRGLLTHGDFDPDVPVEFHWYSGEEAGLLGSQAVAKAYRQAGRRIVGMMQMDMTGYIGKSEKVGIVTDFTDPQLTQLLRQLVTSYTRLQPSDMKCGYACSDHASWNKAGYRSVMPFEDDDLEANPNIHTTRDTVSTIKFNHCLEFAKIAVGFAVELSYRQK
ncbi:hypothetical protein BJ085DRAFT_43284 [Dimargaris cristalligena]|uniref:Peptide hydrolase n=1 Tax=Dimargaris cristalligena TaxID=215637 RepID=A0A4P9ZQ63_9FUNG|nr:hypothetical protein BJ085DRAFT_43284 [Dimargaris cristalligena]|eukprot:RKP34510.1 hypothetical protein BJ085DRAFT_43284 [Dimargaris cristalligena]